MNKKDLEFQPVNVNERLLYGCMIRLDALCDMVNSLVEYVAEKEKIATTSVNVKEIEVAKPTPKKKATPKKKVDKEEV
jgi:hypothetical protein